MRVRLVFGPAGSGKTHRCLAEVRAALAAAPDGPPLLFLTPKQATFQIERQLLADPAVAGFARLRILSFDRLALWVLGELGVPEPEWLAEEGRLMVLRALLNARRDRLTVFRATARLTGFAAELSDLLRRLQRHGVAPERLTQLANAPGLSPTLRDKLADFAHLLAAYREWLAAHGLQDAEALPDAAVAALRAAQGAYPPALRFAALWLDGFAEMTPQELALLTALLPAGEEATLAFCWEASPGHPAGWLSAWSAVGETVRRLRARLEALPGVAIEEEMLPRRPERGRFASVPALQHLEARWNTPRAFAGRADPAVRMIECADARQEVCVAAREILRFVREVGGRFREAAVLVRSLEGYHEWVQREFCRRDIPFFLDRRESVAHHPLAELTRSALRTVAFDWRHADWFSALKTGLVHRDAAALDHLENEALARGWEGCRWRQPLTIPEQPALAARLEALRAQILPPFEELARRLTERPPTGAELAEALREFWERLKVEAQLARWAETAAAAHRPAGVLPTAGVHRAVWEQMLSWLENLRLAFPTERAPLRDWLPVLEAGLARLTVGVIPPTLDAVLVGAVDRSRNPDLRLTLVLGLNEGVFPAAPGPLPLLTDTEQRALEQAGLDLDADPRRQVSRERYLGYIACTRARERLILTLARTDAAGRPLNPSPWVRRLKQLFPELPVEEACPPTQAAEVLHPVEIFELAPSPESLAHPALTRLLANLGWSAERTAHRPDRDPGEAERLAPALAARLYGAGSLTISVSKLEQFAACPFRFFLAAGLRADERRRFEVDARQRGSFVHEVLRRFHEAATSAGRRWRDFTPEEARARVGEIGRAVAEEFGDGLWQAEAGGRLSARALVRQVQDFVAVLVDWMRQGSAFDPAAAELAFGGRDTPLPAWTLPLPGGGALHLHGKVDRVDVAPGPEPDTAWCVVHDYKTSEHKFDPVEFEHGIQLQLPAYLAAVCALGLPTGLPPGGVRAEGGVRLLPAGFFYANLRGPSGTARSRRAVLDPPPEDAQTGYPHRGRFARSIVEALGAATGGPFVYKVNRNGTLASRSNDAVEPDQFEGHLAQLRETLVTLARRILAGEAAVDPYQKGGQKACDLCRYAAVCRIDPWTHRFRRLDRGRRG